MTGLIAILVVSGTVIFAVGGMMIVRRRVPVEVLETQHEVGGFLYSALAVIYGILLAFVVFVVWTSYQSASDAVATEADQLVDLLRLSEGFPPETGAAIRQSLRRYTSAVIVEEWPAMRDGHESPSVEKDIESLWGGFVQPPSPVASYESVLYQESLERMAHLSDSRRARLGKSNARISAMLWILLLGGGMIMILFTYFFGIRNVRAQMLMTAALASQIAFILFLIAAIDRPFDGVMRIGTQPFQRVIQRIDAR
jgi:hypothetical protein